MVIIDKLEGERIDLVLSNIATKNDNYGTLLYDICLKVSGIKVGMCDVRLGYNEELYYIGNIGFSIKEEHRGNGFAVEAVDLIKKIFRMNNMNRIYIVNNPDNHACIRVCEKLGAKFIKLVDIPKHLRIALDDEESYKNIWELKV